MDAQLTFALLTSPKIIMLPKSFLAIVQVALNWPITTLAVPSQPMEPRAGAVCSSGLYGELAPILAGYSIAQSFCTSNYPVKCTTSPKIKRTPSTKSATTSKQTKTSKTTATTKTPPTTTQPKTTSTATDPKASAWSKCQSQGANFVSTLCSCIETPKVCRPVTVRFFGDSICVVDLQLTQPFRLVLLLPPRLQPRSTLALQMRAVVLVVQTRMVPIAVVWLMYNQTTTAADLYTASTIMEPMLGVAVIISTAIAIQDVLPAMLASSTPVIQAAISLANQSMIQIVSHILIPGNSCLGEWLKVRQHELWRGQTTDVEPKDVWWKGCESILQLLVLSSCLV